MTAGVFDRIRALLDERGVAYRVVEHAPTRTSEESAAARGEPLDVGAKALLLKTDDVFRLFVMCADTQLDSGAVRKFLGVKKTRFATPDELRELTGLVPGSVPPFGEPVLPFALYADEQIGVRHDRVAFNAGSLTTSVVMPAADWRQIAKPQQFAFAKPAE
jgi:prolyl-tRNA editing enzyme YbaK/EbsC (Cys-tRNA(Pro) deacylase)